MKKHIAIKVLTIILGMGFFIACQPREVIVVVTSTTEPTQTAIPSNTPVPTNTATIQPTETKVEFTPTATLPSDKRQLLFISKLAGQPYFELGSYPGAEEAAKELGYELTIKAPKEWDSNEQRQFIDEAINEGEVDAILVSAQNPKTLCSLLNKAMSEGIVVVSWDADTNCRQLYQNHANEEELGRSLIKMMCDNNGGPNNCTGEIAVVSLNEVFQKNIVAWMEEEWKKPEYENMELVEVIIGDDIPESGYEAAEKLIINYPNLKGIIVTAGGSISGVADYIEEINISDQIKVTGFGLPSQLKNYVYSDTIPQFALWNPTDQAYLAIYMANAILRGEIKGEQYEIFKAGRLGEFTIREDGEVLLGPPIIFNMDNIDDFNF